MTTREEELEKVEELREEVEELRRENAFLRDLVAAYHVMTEMARGRRREPEGAA